MSFIRIYFGFFQVSNVHNEPLKVESRRLSHNQISVENGQKKKFYSFVQKVSRYLIVEPKKKIFCAKSGRKY